MDTFVNYCAKQRRRERGQRHPLPRRDQRHVGTHPTTAVLVANSPQEVVTTFLPAAWHPKPASWPLTAHHTAPDPTCTEDSSVAGLYDGAMSVPARSSRGFFNSALAPNKDHAHTSQWPWASSVKAEAPPSPLSVCGPTHRRYDRSEEAAASADTLRLAAPGLHAPASARAVRGQDATRLPPLLSLTTVRCHSDTVCSESVIPPASHAPSPLLSSSTPTPTMAGVDTSECVLGDAPFSALVLDFETTGFSATHEHIVEVGAVELRWTGRRSTRDTTHCPEGGHDSARGEWRFGTRSFHRYVDPGKTDLRWWRRRQRRDATSTTTTAASVHGLDPCFLSEHGVSWGDAAAALVKFCEQLLRRRPFSDDDDDSDSESENSSPSLSPTSVHLPPFVAHRAAFDKGFLETHLRRAGFCVEWHAQAPVTCTMKLCKSLYPQQPSNLDAACQFFGIEERLERARHGALLDATLCAQLYLRLEGRVREQLDMARQGEHVG